LELKILAALIPIVGYLYEQEIVGLVDLLLEWQKKEFTRIFQNNIEIIGVFIIFSSWFLEL